MSAATYHLATDAKLETRSCEMPSFLNDLKGRNAVLVFTQEGCLPCAEYVQELGQIGDQPGTDFAMVDVNACAAAADQFKVRETPTILVVKDGKEIFRVDLTGDAAKDLSTLPGRL